MKTLERKSALAEEILRLKKERNAVILAHNYQKPEVQEIADFVGDSLGLSIKAQNTEAEVIVFCGVHFMAETASILNPSKKVLLPDLLAGCSMADMISVDILLDLKEKHPDALVCSYVNTTAEIKAESDICCTSSNAVEVVNSLPPDKSVIFVPDKYLGRWVQMQTGRNMILYDGWCPIHMELKEQGIQALKRQHPDALVVAHPESPIEVSSMADIVASTEQMVRTVASLEQKEFIIATETGILHKMRRENPDKVFYAANDLAICPHMKMNDLDKIQACLENLAPEVKVPEAIRERAWRPLQRMLDLKLPYKEAFVGCKC
ncbi:MAG: quinolinate synthase NadA [candidate division FCPU426 bacterium]